MDASTYKAQLVAAAEDAVARMLSKVERARADLDGALDSLNKAKDELAHVRASTPEWVEPAEHVRVYVP